MYSVNWGGCPPNSVIIDAGANMAFVVAEVYMHVREAGNVTSVMMTDFGHRLSSLCALH